jgi:hypothetical protein
LVEEIPLMNREVDDLTKKTITVFFSFYLPGVDIANRTRNYLEKQSPVRVLLTSLSSHGGPWPDQVADGLIGSDAFVLFAGREFGEKQQHEAMWAYRQYTKGNALPADAHKLSLMVVQVNDVIGWPGDGEWVRAFQQIPPIKFVPDPLSATTADVGQGNVHDGQVQRVAQAICVALGWGVYWKHDFEIPSGYPFSYEKEIIREFAQNGGRLSDKRVSEGCPREWPKIVKRDATRPNRVPKNLVGDFSDPGDCVVVDVRTGRGEPPSVNLTFSEARPLEHFFGCRDPRD